MGTSGTLETLGGNGGGLDGFLRGLLVLFVLSLAAERISSVFKHRNWQPLRPRMRNKEDGGNLQVDLRTGETYVDSAKQPVPIALGGNEVDRLTRTANAENTLFIGLLLALVSGANAFLGTCGWPDFTQGGTPIRSTLTFVGQVLLTGAASAIGSSFWDELLNLLTDSRRVRSAQAQQKSSDSPPPSHQPGTPLIPAMPLTDTVSPTFFSSPEPPRPVPVQLGQLRQAAQHKLPELQRLEGVKQVRLVDAPRRWASHPCLEFRVELEPGAPAPPAEIKVNVGGVEHSIPVTR
ncbi:hypothetical protein ATI61_11679 [Archangium gephyra]|uniref:Uncharacterized protein n=1 Tax=Archangium gephyra TaxID=48 RepID=A0AAC8QAK8_9BACT|nr:hypothetical protein [Archangium gephyra]AKJ03830.1 Hypothetical protein AA314_05456 [Archangium gephyra]REG23609.1 hypothetical protein ATI61_11679 [Archangium gephyra]